MIIDRLFVIDLIEDGCYNNVIENKYALALDDCIKIISVS